MPSMDQDPLGLGYVKKGIGESNIVGADGLLKGPSTTPDRVESRAASREGLPGAVDVAEVERLETEGYPAVGSTGDYHIPVTSGDGEPNKVEPGQIGHNPDVDETPNPPVIQ